ncbi:substrate-binding domain-containing protein [Microbacterium aerolatum]|uniref:HTH iclR-type domain-containing protein n=1 Tax=Microbacterium aerolatum TaxID=153731 RepID=A0A511ACE2_9MICO|nr:substrate-binding domain-containing protein [Microbacterium aerolatum]GEK85676.1 hypothetical protein MAE01_08520 [Microbacterium aerolatum]GGB21263.1 hypothetical protein GCM10007198_09650 [Microbacterium aerolatum]
MLDAIASSTDPLTLSQIARSAAIPKSTTQQLLRELESERWIAQSSRGGFKIGPRLIELAALARRNLGVVRRVGFSVAADSAYYRAESTALEDATQERGGRLFVRNAAGDLAAQRDDIGQFVDGRVEVIIIDPVSSHGLESAAAHARAAGIPLVSVNGRTTGVDAAVTTDNVQAGHLIARLISDLLGGTGRVAVIGGTAITAVADRIVGLENYLRDIPGVRIVGMEPSLNTTASGQASTQKLLDKLDELPDAIFGINDPVSQGIEEALTERGIRIPIFGVDGSSWARENMLAGGMLHASVAQEPGAMVRTALELAVDTREGNMPTNRLMQLATTVVTPETAEEYRPW